MSDMAHWGIIGTGRISVALVEAIREAGGEVVAIGSSSRERAESFGDLHRIPRRYDSHEAVASDPDLDVVYIASTNDLHHRHALEVIAKSVPVMCEKPFALNAGQAREMVSAARDRGVFLMEAMWMRFQPATDRLLDLISESRVGQVHSVQADFGFPASPHPSDRLFDPTLGGGTILDLGVYVVTLASLVLGPVETVTADVQRSERGVDLQAGIVLRHEGGGFSTLSTSFITDTSSEAVISGPGGRIRLHAPFHHSPKITIERGTTLVETIDMAPTGSEYRFEVEEVHRCLDARLTESPKMPLDDTLAVMDVLDRIRAEVGLTYPGE